MFSSQLYDLLELMSMYTVCSVLLVAMKVTLEPEDSSGVITSPPTKQWEFNVLVLCYVYVLRQMIVECQANQEIFMFRI